MKDFKALISYLYDSPEEASFKDELLNLAEQIKTENAIEVKKGPLTKALVALGVDVSGGKLIPDYGSAVAHFDCAEAYQDALNCLESPEGMEKLAQLGWVMTRCGNSGNLEPEAPDYRIRFLELDLHDGPVVADEKPEDLDAAMKDVADTFSKDTEDPKRKLQAKAEESRKAHQLIDQVLECGSAKGKKFSGKKKLAPSKVAAVMKLKKK